MQGDDDHPRRVNGLIGTVTHGPFGTGSKSERQAVWLQAGADRFVLRRKDGPSFGDRVLDGYVGHRVSCDGFVVGYLLLLEKIEMMGEH